MVSNIEDMFKWLTLHLNEGVYEGKRLVSEKNMREMHHMQAPMHMFPWKFPEVDTDGSYGMEWLFSIIVAVSLYGTRRIRGFVHEVFCG